MVWSPRVLIQDKRENTEKDCKISPLQERVFKKNDIAIHCNELYTVTKPISKSSKKQEKPNIYSLKAKKES